MKIKKSDLQKIINEVVLKEMAQGAAPKIIRMALKDEELRTAFLEDQVTAFDAAKSAAEAYVKSEMGRFKQEVLHWGNLEYIANELKKNWK